MKKEYLYSPGPVTVPPEVLAKMSEPIYHHRSPRFRKIFAEVNLKLKQLFVTKNDVLTFCASGTGAMEASLVNFLSAGDKIITVNAGKFGQRWSEIGRAYGLEVLEIKAEWGSAVEPALIADLLQANPDVKAVYTELAETSTGTLFDIQALGAIVAKTDAILVVDAISALGADEINVDSWSVDVCVAGSQKGMMIPPGLSFISVSDKAWKLAQASCLPKFYFDALKARKALATLDTPFTPAHTLIGALNCSLAMILNEGLNNVLARRKKYAEAIRQAIIALGLELYSACPANALTAISFKNLDAVEVRHQLEQEGICVAGGQAQAKGQIIRVAMLGYTNSDDVVNFVTALERILIKMNAKIEVGAGLKAAQRVLA